MTGFERASLALIYNLYYSWKTYSTGQAIRNKRFVVETFDEDNNFKRKRYFVVRELSAQAWDIALDEGYRYRAYNSAPIIKHASVLMTEERPNEKIDVDPMNSSYVTGMGAGYRFTMEEYGFDRVKTRDEEHRKTYNYKISQ